MLCWRIRTFWTHDSKLGSEITSVCKPISSIDITHVSHIGSEITAVGKLIPSINIAHVSHIGSEITAVGKLISSINIAHVSQLGSEITRLLAWLCFYWYSCSELLALNISIFQCTKKQKQKALLKRGRQPNSPSDLGVQDSQGTRGLPHDPAHTCHRTHDKNSQ